MRNKKKRIKRYIPPAFFVMLAVSLIMWWLTQLSKDYSGIQVPVTVKVEGNIFEVDCFASGNGFQLAARRILHETVVEMPYAELEVTPSMIREGWGIIEPESLLKAISSRIHDVDIERVGVIPEILIRGRQ